MQKKVEDILSRLTSSEVQFLKTSKEGEDGLRRWEHCVTPCPITVFIDAKMRLYRYAFSDISHSTIHFLGISMVSFFLFSRTLNGGKKT